VSAGHSSEIYCLDADALINIQRYYPKALRQISRYGKAGKIVIPEGVYRELCRKTDHLKDMVQTWRSKHDAVIRLDTPTLREEVARMERAYGEKIHLGKQTRNGFWASKSGKLAADSQVVAVCKVNRYIAVSNDQAVQDACHIENVPCIPWQEFYRRMKQGFTGQGLLFD
jgi:rRNA-processing protein FCF1